MHETSLIQYTMDAVERRASQLNIHRIKSIHLVVGGMRGALPNLMQEAFGILSHSQPLFHHAILEIEEKPVILRCSSCGNQYTSEEFHAVHCPICGAREYKILTGNELYIDYFEGD